MGLIRWLLGDTREVVAGRYVGDRIPSVRREPIPPGARGMFMDPSQVPMTLMKPSMQPAHPPQPESED